MLQSRVGDLIFGDFEVMELAGTGATSFVYRCKSTRSDLPAEVAVKVLKTELQGLEPSRRRFLREAHLLQKLDHPNIVRVYEIIETPMFLAYVMEHVDGPSLKEWFAQRKAGMDGVFQVMTIEMLGALGYIHDQGIIHRDIKPANVLVSRTVAGLNSPKLIDFGVARLADADPDPEDLNAIRGTAAYISPDEIRSAYEVCASSDLYSLGVLVYEAISGVRPFDGLAKRELLCAHLHQTPLAPSAHNDALAPAFDEVVLKMLAKTPELRYESAQVLRKAFVGAIAATLDAEIPIDVQEPVEGAGSQGAGWMTVVQMVMLQVLFSLIEPSNSGEMSQGHHHRHTHLDLPLVA
jgi:serine/threonine-protein kinase